MDLYSALSLRTLSVEMHVQMLHARPVRLRSRRDRPIPIPPVPRRFAIRCDIPPIAHAPAQRINALSRLAYPVYGMIELHRLRARREHLRVQHSADANSECRTSDDDNKVERLLRGADHFLAGVQVVPGHAPIVGSAALLGRAYHAQRIVAGRLAGLLVAEGGDAAELLLLMEGGVECWSCDGRS